MESVTWLLAGIVIWFLAHKAADGPESRAQNNEEEER